MTAQSVKCPAKQHCQRTGLEEVCAMKRGPALQVSQLGLGGPRLLRLLDDLHITPLQMYFRPLRLLLLLPLICCLWKFSLGTGQSAKSCMGSLRSHADALHQARGPVARPCSTAPEAGPQRRHAGTLHPAAGLPGSCHAHLQPGSGQRERQMRHAVLTRRAWADAVDSNSTLTTCESQAICSLLFQASPALILLLRVM